MLHVLCTTSSPRPYVSPEENETVSFSSGETYGRGDDVDIMYCLEYFFICSAAMTEKRNRSKRRNCKSPFILYSQDTISHNSLY